MPVDSNGIMSFLSQFKTLLLLNKLGCQEGWVLYRAILLLSTKATVAHTCRNSQNRVEKFCEHLSEFPSFLFFPFLSLSFSSIPLYGYK